MAKCKDMKITENYALYNGDCVELIKEIPDDSIGYSIFSPPFAELYAYSDHTEDMGNSSSYEQFFEHFGYLVEELNRVIEPGRLVSVHCIDIPAMKARDGYIGIKDFPGDIVRCFQNYDFIYHSRHTIWKDPLTEATRTKALGLMHKQLCKDSNMCRAGLPDYVLTFRKKGINKKPIKKPDGLTKYYGAEKISGSGIKRSHNIWRKYASPVWMDIRQSETLNKSAAREEKDQKHICPLQTDVVERCIALWTYEGDINVEPDTILTPFGGIGTEAFVALKNKRKAILFELKESYYNQAVMNCNQAITLRNKEQGSLI